MLIASLAQSGTAHSSEKAEDLAIEAKSLFFTSSGRIGVILDMDKELSLHMTALQRNLNSVVKEMGGTTHRRYVLSGRPSLNELELKLLDLVD